MNSVGMGVRKEGLTNEALLFTKTVLGALVVKEDERCGVLQLHQLAHHLHVSGARVHALSHTAVGDFGGALVERLASIRIGGMSARTTRRSLSSTR